MLNGDSTLRGAQAAFQTLLGKVPAELSTATLQHLSDIGVSLQKDGKLTVDSTKLSAAIASDFTGVANLVSAYGSAFKAAADGLVAAGGLIAARSDGLSASIVSLGKQSDVITQRLTEIEKRYRSQFTALDVLLTGMSKTSDYLTQQLANLPKIS